jgi:hypothetical protein
VDEEERGFGPIGLQNNYLGDEGQYYFSIYKCLTIRETILLRDGGRIFELITDWIVLLLLKHIDGLS